MTSVSPAIARPRFTRPQQGRGRTDTFNPTKIVVFHLPDDNSIGTTDLPQVWNQRPREHMWLHWDGNNNEIAQRNYAAAMAVGATPESVLPDNFKRVTDFLLDLKPPTFNIVTPANGATYKADQVVNASYTCNDGGSGVVPMSCVGTVANTGKTDTVPRGVSTQKTFMVKASDAQADSA